MKAGAIIPFGPDVQYSTEKKWENLDIRVYEGANGNFTLYEDENDNYNYEKGAYTTIVLKWDQKSRTLNISDRKGSYTGMLAKRNFNVELITLNANKTGAKTNTRSVEYKGKSIAIKF